MHGIKCNGLAPAEEEEEEKEEEEEAGDAARHNEGFERCGIKRPSWGCGRSGPAPPRRRSPPAVCPLWRGAAAREAAAEPGAVSVAVTRKDGALPSPASLSPYTSSRQRFPPAFKALFSLFPPAPPPQAALPAGCHELRARRCPPCGR